MGVRSMKTILKIVYKTKFYIDISVHQISWITGKLPELMALVYLLEKFDIILNKNGIISVMVFGMIGLFLFGYLWKKLGFYDIEVYVNANRNPMFKELLNAARKINEKEKK